MSTVVQNSETTTEQQQYSYATGKRKASIARVKIFRDDTRGGEYSINGKSLEQAFPWFTWQGTIEQPFVATGMKGKFYVEVKLTGGGVSSQSEALRHGIARALVRADENLKTVLRQNRLLTRDSRVKERKKPGLKRARKAPQYTKR